MANIQERIEVLVREVAALQSQLLDALHTAFPLVAHSLPPKWPRRVELRIGGITWHGSVHGMGYRFEAEDGSVIEAHDRIQEAPYPIDAYRTAVYAQSRGIQAITSLNSPAVEPEPETLDPLLPFLEQAGVLVRDVRVAPPRTPRYLVVGPAIEDHHSV
jgi:hypothetical protein